MSIEIGSKWVKDGEVVEVVDYCKNDCICAKATMCVWFSNYKKNTNHVITDNDFLEQYKPYEVVYEYKYAYPIIKDDHEIIIVQNVYLTDEQMEKSGIKEYQRLDFTKREREQ